MKDQYGRQINYMRVSVTDRCNLRCIYCMPEEGVDQVSHQDILTYAEITRIVNAAAAAGITRIKLTGGEPLVRKNLAGLAGDIKALPGIEEVTVTTNGVLLKEQLEDLVGSRGQRGQYQSGYAGSRDVCADCKKRCACVGSGRPRGSDRLSGSEGEG